MSKKQRTVIRAAYIIVLFLLTLLAVLHGLGEKFGDVPGRVIAALSAIDPFYIVGQIFEPGRPDLCAMAWGPEYHRWHCDGWMGLFTQGGWLALLVVGGPLVTFLWFMWRVKQEEQQHEEVAVAIIGIVGLLLTGVVSFGLKWLLIGLMYAFGAAIGFVSWIGLTVITPIETFLHLHDLIKSGAEVKEAIKEIPKS